MEQIYLDGLGVALITPFQEDEKVDYEALAKVIEHVIAGGADYLVVLGTTAETPTLSYDEKLEITRFVKDKTNGRIPLVIGIGGNNTIGVVTDILSRNLEGYSAILSVAPYYNKPTQEGLYRHFKEIADTSPLPVILYNVPGRTGVNLTAETTLRLVRDSGNIIAIKEASNNLTQCQKILDGHINGFNLISGNDSDTFSVMKMGGTGVISVLANAAPSVMKKLVELCNQSNFQKASELQKALSPIITHLFEDGNPAGVKAMLAHIGMVKNILRLPLVPVNDHLKNKLITDLDILNSL